MVHLFCLSSNSEYFTPFRVIRRNVGGVMTSVLDGFRDTGMCWPRPPVTALW